MKNTLVILLLLGSTSAFAGAGATGLTCYDATGKTSVSVEVGVTNTVTSSGFADKEANFKISDVKLTASILVDEKSGTVSAFATNGEGKIVQIVGSKLKMAFSSGTSWADGQSRDFTRATVLTTGAHSYIQQSGMTCSYENLEVTFPGEK